MGLLLDLRRVDSVSISKVKKDLSELLCQAETGVQFLIMRRHVPAGFLTSYADYQRYQELLRRESLAVALLRGRGLEVSDLSTEGFIDLLDHHLKRGVR